MPRRRARDIAGSTTADPLTRTICASRSEQIVEEAPRPCAQRISGTEGRGPTDGRARGCAGSGARQPLSPCGPPTSPPAGCADSSNPPPARSPSPGLLLSFSPWVSPFRPNRRGGRTRRPLTGSVGERRERVAWPARGGRRSWCRRGCSGGADRKRRGRRPGRCGRDGGLQVGGPGPRRRARGC